VAFLALTGSALAGTTATTAVTYAREVGAVNAVYTLPASSVTRQLAVIRADSQDFFVDVTLGQGALLTAGSLPANADMTVADGGGGAGVATAAIVSGGTAGSATVRYFIDITTSFQGLGLITLDTSTWTIRDVNNTLGGGNPIQITITTSDSATNVAFDGGTDTVTLMTSKYGVTAGTLTSTTATVDVAQNRKMFVATGGDTTTTDTGASIVLANTGGASVRNLAGTQFTATSADKVDIVIAGNLSGITSISLGTASKGIAAADVTAGTVTLTLAGNSAEAAAGGAFVITVDGSTQLTARTLTVAVNYRSGLTSTAYAATQDHSMASAATLTVWSLNGTVLVANWTNGNNAALNTRIYLWNPSATGGNITARVFTLSIDSSTGTGTPLATVAIGTIGGTSGRNIRVAEDVLLPAGVTLPYTTDGGNLVVEVTIEASNVSGVSQAFSGGLAYGTTPMTKIN